jgi:hypothetical protein
MQPAARTGERFQRRNGSSTLRIQTERVEGGRGSHKEGDEGEGNEGEESQWAQHKTDQA